MPCSLRMLRRLTAATALAVSTLLVGCFGAREVTAPTTTPDTGGLPSVSVDSIAPAPVSATPVLAPVLELLTDILVPKLADSLTVDGATGGTIGNGTVQLDIPAGAFAGTATVGFTMPDPLTERARLFIHPDSLNHFAKPVKLTFYAHGAANAADLGVLWFEPTSGLWFGLTTSAYDSTTDAVSVNLRHFSTYGAGGRAGW